MEAFRPYYDTLCRIAFDAVKVFNHHADIREYLSEWGLKSYDVALLIDVLEHLEKHDGEDLLRFLQTISKRIIIFLPLGVCKQDAYDNNAFQKHLSTWEKSDFDGNDGWDLEVLPDFHKHFSPAVTAAWAIHTVGSVQ